MGRRKKWGSRRLRTPDFGRMRLRWPHFSWDGIPVAAGKRSVFKARRHFSGGFNLGFEPKKTKRKLWRGSGEAKVSTVRNGQVKKRSGRKFWLILSLLIILAVLQSIRYIESHLKPPIIHLAQIRVKQIATESINKAITAQVAGNGNAEQLIDWKTDKNGKISGFMLNYREHMRITSQAADVIQTTLQSLHNHKEYIPLGQALGSPIIASFGPDIPIKIEPQGAVKVELNTRQQNAGINMILVEVYIHIVTEVAVVIPFDIEPQIVDTEIPVSYLMVVGDVPMYYYDNQGQPVGTNGSSAPGISIPAPQLDTKKDNDSQVSVQTLNEAIQEGSESDTTNAPVSGSTDDSKGETAGTNSGSE